jgi:hypothetical protein
MLARRSIDGGRREGISFSSEKVVDLGLLVHVVHDHGWSWGEMNEGLNAESANRIRDKMEGERVARARWGGN